MELDLVTQAQRGDERVFAELAFGIGNRLHAVAYRILRDIGLAKTPPRRRWSHQYGQHC